MYDSSALHDRTQPLKFLLSNAKEFYYFLKILRQSHVTKPVRKNSIVLYLRVHVRIILWSFFSVYVGMYS